MRPRAVDLGWIVVAAACAFGAPAVAGRNVYTDRFPHPKSIRGWEVTCTTRGCQHKGPIVHYVKDGLHYRTAVRVTRKGKTFGLVVQLEFSVVDGRRHGYLKGVGFSGSVKPLGRYAGPITGFLGGLSISSHYPSIGPGQSRVSRRSYPDSAHKTAVKRGYVLTLDISPSQVVHYNPRRSGSPTVAKVELRVPLRGPPRLLLRSP